MKTVLALILAALFCACAPRVIPCPAQDEPMAKVAPAVQLRLAINALIETCKPIPGASFAVRCDQVVIERLSAMVLEVSK